MFEGGKSSALLGATARVSGRWVAEHAGTFLVSLADAFELGRQKNAGQCPDVLE